eukprot:182327-Chlamydomonas_euryale.AAC.5
MPPLALPFPQGTHHAFPSFGSGYCILNDLAVTAEVRLCSFCGVDGEPRDRPAWPHAWGIGVTCMRMLLGAASMVVCMGHWGSMHA